MLALQIVRRTTHQTQKPFLDVDPTAGLGFHCLSSLTWNLYSESEIEIYGVGAHMQYNRF